MCHFVRRKYIGSVQERQNLVHLVSRFMSTTLLVLPVLNITWWVALIKRY